MFGGLIQLAKSLKGVLEFHLDSNFNPCPQVQAALPDGLCVCRFHSLLAVP